MKWTRKAIENTIIISLAVLTAGSLVYVPLASYLPFKENQEQIMSAAIERDNKTLKTIEATLKPGVKVFDNGLATLTNKDFDVYAVYGGKYADAIKLLLEPDQYTIAVPNDFASVGGIVTISYLGKTLEVDIPLKKIELTQIAVKENPYKVTYAKGENFNATGLVLNLIYNDGSHKELSGSGTNVSVSNGNNLAIGTKSVTVKYTEKSITKEVEVPITVVESVDNGAISSLTYVGEYRVNAGETFSGSINVLAKYDKTQNREILPSSQYKLEGAGYVAELGKLYQVKATLLSDTSKSVNIPVTVNQKIEGETATLRNAKTNTEPEYTLENGSFKKGNNVTFAAVAGAMTAKGETCSVKFSVNSASNCVSRLIVKSSNPYYQNGAMSPLVLNHIMDVNVNGHKNYLDDSVILKGTPNGETVEVYNIYYEYDLGHVQLNAGANEIELFVHASSFGEMTSWDEPPCSVNIDYVRFETYNHVHNAVKVDATPSSCEKEGNIEHYYCDICGQHYEDSGCTTHIPSVVIPGLEHQFNEWTFDEESHTSICARGCGVSETSSHDVYISYEDDSYCKKCKVCNYTKKIDEIKGLYIPESFVPKYGDEITTTPIYALVGDDRYEIDLSIVNITNSNDPDNKYFLYGDNVIRVELKANPSIFVTKTYSLASYYYSDLKYVDLVQDDDKVYWTFEFYNVGYKASHYRLFDGSITFEHEVVEETLTTLKLRVDVTEYGSTTYFPHASYTVNGTTTLYYAHKNGDLLVTDSKWNKNKSISLNGRTYRLALEWDMATLVIS